VVAVTALSGCSAIRVQPAYGACGGSQTNPSCAIVGDRVEVAYEARCDGECTARFQLPDANYAAESFSGSFRRSVTFNLSAVRAVTFEIEPTAPEHTVRMARIDVDGRRQASMDSGDMKPGRTVSLSAVLQSGR